MKRKMILISLFFFAGLLTFGIAYYFVRNSVLLTFAITFGTCFYHFGMRLLVGGVIDSIFRNKMNYNRWWFRERKHETSFYNSIRVKSWKRHLPTYKPDDFDIRKHSLEEIIQTTCQSEVVHEINMVLSFLPIILIIWFGSPAAFIITSLVAFFFDGIFVIVQRYNRPRLRRLLKLKKSI